MTDEITPQSMEEFKKVGRQTLYKAIAGGLIAGVVAAGGILWSYVSSLSGDLGLVPNGAVMAFDLNSGCPSGWKNVSEVDADRFAGRVIIAVGPRVDRKPKGTTLKRKFDDQGGQESVALTEPQMPSHYHGIFFSLADGKGAPLHWFNNSKASNTVASQSKGPEPGGHQPIVGQNQPHNNMPPYIALYYCKKG